MPGKTTIKTNAVPTELGEIKAHITSATQGESAFLVIYADYPESVLKADPQSILAGARSGAVKRMNGQLQSEKKITLNGFAGREFAATAVVGQEKKKMFVRARLYLARRRLYQLIVVGPEKTKPTDAIKTFFDSFKISK